ncbi:MAG TPA: UDP-N-acetylmuramoyl-tripeptide--D-alanyl-D-alanine ligase [Verrucomicrobiae bacterium]
MEERSLKFVAEACAAEIRRGAAEVLVKNVCTDSRQAKAGDLFFAIRGEKFDGHDFLNEVSAKNVAAIVVARASRPCVDEKLTGKMPVPLLIVDDPRIALGKLAAAYRTQFDLPIVCVGGSNGKTTVKELLASVLRQKFSTLASEASFNNDIGVPLTLLRLEKSHQVAVLEAGTNHPGELAPLVKMIQPKFGVLTNVGREHLEFFGDVVGVVQEEGWLAELLPSDGKLFVNGDNEWTEKIVQRTKAKIVRVGLGEKNDWRADKIRLDKNGVTFRVVARASRPCVSENVGSLNELTGETPVPLQDFCGEYRINLLGRHQVTNALFAIAVGEELDLSRAEIQSGLAECKPPKMRLQFWEANGVRILDDAYNANADSTIAALETLCDLPLQGRRVAVLGDMAELGAHSESAHAEVGRRAAELKIGQLFAVGKMAAVTAKAARDGGLNRVIEFENVEAAVTVIRKFLKTGDVVLLKASRASRLERIAETLKTEK